MSSNKVNKITGELVTLANGSRMWVGTKAAHDAQVLAGTMPNNCMVCLTDDYNESYDTYSTDEVKTNKIWIDGKPIYRKVLELNSPTITWQPINISEYVPNRDMIFKGDIVFAVSSSGMILSEYGRSDIDELAVLVGKNVNSVASAIYCYSTNAISKLVVTVEYTKTTD